MTDTLLRSLAKTLLWRAIGTAMTLVVVYLFTGSLTKASTITLTTACLLAVGYYFHERMWDRIEWGRKHFAFSSTQNEASEIA